MEQPEQILLDFDGVFFHLLICWCGFGTHWVSNNCTRALCSLLPSLLAVTLLWVWAAAFDPVLQESENLTLIEKSCTTWVWSHTGFMEWLQSLIETWLKTEIDNYFPFWSDLPDFTIWMWSHICKLWLYETVWTLWLLLSCLCYYSVVKKFYYQYWVMMLSADKSISCSGLACFSFRAAKVGKCGGEPFRMLKTLMETMNCGSQENFRVRRIARSVWNQAMLDVLQTCWCFYGLMPSVVEKHMGNSQEMDVVFETVPVLSCECSCWPRDLLVLWVALRGRLLRLNWSVWPVWGEWFAVSFFHFCLSLPSRHKWQSCLVVGKGRLPTRARALCQVLFLWLRLCRPSYKCPIFDCFVNYYTSL